METNLGVEKEDLARAKRDLLMRFIKDQEKLQTRQDGIASNNDTTFDILDGLTVLKDDFSNNVCMKQGGVLTDNITYKQNEHSKADFEGVAQQSSRTQTCIPSFRVRNESSLLDLREKQLKVDKRGKKSQLNTAEKSFTGGGSARRLRSAPIFSNRQSRNIVRSGDEDLKAKKITSLSIVVPNENDIDKTLLTKSGRRSSLTCAQVTAKNRGAAVDISAVDVELFGRHSVPSMTSPYGVYHLPPIGTTPPST